MESVVVTGVSTGIGNGTLRELIQAGYTVFGSVRKQQDADRLSKEFGPAYVPLIFDVTDAAAVARAVESVRKTLGGGKLAGLVNNAGVAVPGPLMELSVEDFRRQIEVNLVSVFAVTRAFFPLLRTSSDDGGRPARIVNISSVGGRFALPFLGPYAASKHGVEGFSDSLRRECMLYGIGVVVIDPATIATPIWSKTNDLDLSVYQSSPYRKAIEKTVAFAAASGRSGSPPELVGRAVARVIKARSPRARYTVGKGKTMIWAIRHLVSTRLADRLIARNLGLTRQAAGR
jgi:NAD(P)-dependent dehydrogenase (short-subunit alcohol dehydrogenase family)